MQQLIVYHSKKDLMMRQLRTVEGCGQMAACIEPNSYAGTFINIGGLGANAAIRWRC